MRSQIHGSHETTLAVKLVVVAILGVTAALHTRARSTRWIAVFGALTGISALAALFPGHPAGRLAPWPGREAHCYGGWQDKAENLPTPLKKPTRG